jgi:hypothetical protein
LHNDPGYKNPGFLFAVKYLAMRFRCKTLFDCAATGVIGHYRVAQIPFRDRNGNLVDGQQSWNRSRNQQRNWETLLQIIGLRCQPQDISVPVKIDTHWCFEFTVENDGVFGGSELEDLYRDCEGIPMITNLDESPGVKSVVSIQDPDRNIWFQSVNTLTEI